MKRSNRWMMLAFPFLGFYLLASSVTSFQLRRNDQPAILNTLQSQRKSNNNVSLRDCPFARTFPRYRIDLTRTSKPLAIQRLNLFADLQLLLLRNRLSKQYNSLMWCEGQSGVRAFTTLCETSARLAAGELRTIDIAFPHCDRNILVNWKELLDWICIHMPSEVQIETTLLEDNQVVRMDCIDGTRNIESTKDQQVSNDDAERRTKSWVKRLLVDLGICPFTKSVTKSGQGLGDVGVPVANIAYHTSHSSSVYQLLADTWGAIRNMILAGPSGKDGVSSILLAAPAFDHDFDYWSGPIFTLLENCVVAAQAESQIGIVCFHPQYATPDGTSWPGFGHMHSVPRLKRWVHEVNGTCSFSQDEVAAGGAWQRRTPHATINVLRADQLEMAESRRNSPQLYTRNIQVLLDIGSNKLLEDLEREQTMGY